LRCTRLPINIQQFLYRKKKKKKKKYIYIIKIIRKERIIKEGRKEREREKERGRLS